jgi:hypothetical protein
MKLLVYLIVGIVNLFRWMLPKEKQVVDEFDIYDPKHDPYEN